mmetsp:Transcript_4402/g.6603  ORF Transcript_4402/g.6603 Transcript_4402/m.6603 type:complete len:410 (+) Transcript_4402:68-1297(+)
MSADSSSIFSPEEMINNAVEQLNNENLSKSIEILQKAIKGYKENANSDDYPTVTLAESAFENAKKFYEKEDLDDTKKSLRAAIDLLQKISLSILDPWTVQGVIDYDKIVDKFGSTRIDDALIARFEKVTGHKAHHWLRRGFFFSHRDLDLILDAHESGEGFFLYTGRGPSSDSLHFGHMIPFLFTKWLQDVFQVPLVIQMTGDEKFLWRGLSIEEARKYTIENIKDIIAVGFDVTKTFIFSNFDYVGRMYPNILRMQKTITASTARSTFGFTMDANVGKWSFCAVQAAPSFSSSFPHIFGKRNVRCLIPCAIDQDPYFRLTRGAAPKFGFYKPALVHSKFFPSLQGYETKMSASSLQSAIFLSDTPAQIRKKVGSAVSGGGETLEEQRENGADLSKDIPFAYLEFFSTR